MASTGRYLSTRRPLRLDPDRPGVLLMQFGEKPSAEDLEVGQVRDTQLAEFLVEAHNDYAAVTEKLIALPHASLLPGEWFLPGRCVRLREVVALLREHLKPNSVGEPMSKAGS